MKVNEGLKDLVGLKIDEITPFQGNLKDLTQKNYLRLKKQILKNGITSPIHVWFLGRGSDGVFCLDGHQRLRALKQMREENIIIPPVPIVRVQAETEKEARSILLGLASTYGQATAEGLDEMLSLAEIELDECDELYSFSLDVMNEEKPKEEKEPRPCPQCGYRKGPGRDKETI